MDEPRLDLRALASLDALVRHESVSKAARELGVSQPTMSRTLARLRAALDDRLLVRSGNRMVPTPRAREVAIAARAAMASIDAATRRATFDPLRAERRFRIEAWDYTQRLLLGPVIRRLRSAAPGVGIEVVPVRDRSPVEALEARTIDVSVGLHRAPREGYRRRRLFRDAFVVCGRDDHPLFGAPITADDFARTPQLLVAPFGATRTGVVDVALRALRLERRVVAFVTNFAAAPEVLRQTDLVATLPREFVARFAPDLRCVASPVPLPEFDIEAMWHASMHDDAAHRWFRELLAEAATELQS